MKTTRRYAVGLAAIVTTTASLLAGTGLAAGAANAASFPAFVGPLHHVTTLASTVPRNGDVNPYGVAVIPRSTGHLRQGNILVSNFNNAGAPPTGNLQGTGSSIVQYAPDGAEIVIERPDGNVRERAAHPDRQFPVLVAGQPPSADV